MDVVRKGSETPVTDEADDISAIEEELNPR